MNATTKSISYYNPYVLNFSCPNHSPISKTWKCPQSKADGSILLQHGIIGELPDHGNEKVTILKAITPQSPNSVVNAVKNLEKKGLV